MTICFPFQLIAALAATLTWKDLKGTPAFNFIGYLWFAIFIELAYLLTNECYAEDPSQLFLWFKQFISDRWLCENIWLSNLYDIVSYMFFMNFFKQILKRKKHIKFMSFATIVIGVCFLIETIINWDIINISANKGTMIVGSLSILIGCGLVMLEYLNSDERLSFYKDYLLWIIMGIICFHLLITPAFLAAEVMGYENTVYLKIIYTGIIISSILFTIGFIVNTLHKRAVRKKSIL
ncbi:hypothetical protein [Robertkochia solimangrovi]|uniref:hypothetical protein n=1 Tax=Robertkochia solimangrovi TaxID=2213046 RepID=UPI0011803CA8|nr:hypothetical protein [Robertkochia solimangrovi]TRZ42567.1 hypothetical protein DMZ48_13785 [Robertkochia solimangrovi]